MSELFMNKQQQEEQRRRHQRRTAKAETLAPATSFNGSSANSSSTRAAKDEQSLAEDENGVEDDAFANILSLTLRKPKHWKWELTTSRSCTNIALPRILLYDHTGELLIDADSQLEQTYRQPCTDYMAANCSESRRRRNSSTRKRGAQRSATSTLAPSIRQALDKEFNGLHIAEATPSPKMTPASTPMHSLSPTPTATTPSSGASSFRQTRQRVPGSSGSCIDFYTNELPDHTQQFERRSSSLKGVRFMFDHAKHNGDHFYADNNNNKTDDIHDQRQSQCNYPTPPSTTTTTTTATPTNSSSSGPREKRRYRRSHSSGRAPGRSTSILERFSFNKGRFSSPEYAEEQQLEHGPRYYLRTSKAGTLVIQEDSFNRHRQRRRRPKNSSSENIVNERESAKSQSTNSLPKQTGPLLQTLAPVLRAGSLQNVTDLQHPLQTVVQGTPLLAVRRYRSDGNVLLQRDMHSSGERLALIQRQPTQQQAHSAQKLYFANPRQQPQHANYAKTYAGDLVTIDAEKRDYRAGQAPTAR